MMEATSVYILNMKTAEGNVVQVVSADLYDWMQEQIGFKKEYDIPDNLLALHKKVPQAKDIKKKVVLTEGNEQVDTWKHVLGCSRDFKTEHEAYKSLGQMCEYAGEIDVYLQ